MPTPTSRAAHCRTVLLAPRCRLLQRPSMSLGIVRRIDQRLTHHHPAVVVIVAFRHPGMEVFVRCNGTTVCATTTAQHHSAVVTRKIVFMLMAFSFPASSEKLAVAVIGSSSVLSPARLLRLGVVNASKLNLSPAFTEQFPFARLRKWSNHRVAVHLRT